MRTVKGTPTSDRSTRSVPAPGTSSAVTSAHAGRTRLPSTRTVTDPTRSPFASGPSSSSGARTRRVHVLPVAQGHARAPRRAHERGLARRGTSRPALRQRAPARHHPHAAEAVEAPAQQRERVGVAGGLAGLAHDHADHARARRCARPTPTSTLPAFVVWPVFTPFTHG